MYKNYNFKHNLLDIFLPLVIIQGAGNISAEKNIIWAESDPKDNQELRQHISSG